MFHYVWLGCYCNFQYTFFVMYTWHFNFEYDGGIFFYDLVYAVLCLKFVPVWVSLSLIWRNFLLWSFWISIWFKQLPWDSSPSCRPILVRFHSFMTPCNFWVFISYVYFELLNPLIIRFRSSSLSLSPDPLHLLLGSLYLQGFSLYFIDEFRVFLLISSSF